MYYYLSAYYQLLTVPKRCTLLEYIYVYIYLPISQCYYLKKPSHSHIIKSIKYSIRNVIIRIY